VNEPSHSCCSELALQEDNGDGGPDHKINNSTTHQIFYGFFGRKISEIVAKEEKKIKQHRNCFSLILF
jgi:hypothetical protein